MAQTVQRRYSFPHTVPGELVRDGVPAGAISILGFGENYLLAPTSAGARANRAPTN